MLSVALPLASAGCHHEAPKAPTRAHVLDEGRAASIMAQAFREAGVQPTGPREIQLVTGKRLRVDVGAAGHAWGVAYLAPLEANELEPGSDYTPAQGDDYPVIMGYGPDANAVVCLLFAQDYAFDDDASAERTSTSIVAAKRLERDVKGFVVQAQRWRLR